MLSSDTEQLHLSSSFSLQWWGVLVRIGVKKEKNQLGFGSDKVVFWALLSNMFKSNHKENKITVQCTVHLYSLLIDYLMADFKHSQIRQLGAEIESISLLCLNAHCRVKFLYADLIFELLRLSTMKKCPHMLRYCQQRYILTLPSLMLSTLRSLVIYKVQDLVIPAAFIIIIYQK